ncbi:MAG: flagellar type III secretion system pore protein FliP [Candidatus Kapaibacteriales bacterium]
MNKIRSWVLILIIGLCFNRIYAQNPSTQSQQLKIPQISISIGGEQSKKNDLTIGIQILLLITVLTLAPSILVMMTSFTRIVVILHFLKQALGTQTQPPSQLLVGLALLLTFFVMQPVFDRANREGLQPYVREEISQDEAMTRITEPFKEFMLKYTREEDLGLFLKLSGKPKPVDQNELSIWTIIPAYTLGELRIAFQIGFLLFVPFLVLDVIIASVLMSLGMFLLPPQLVSLPLKILLFVLVDGWYLVVQSLMNGLIMR